MLIMSNRLIHEHSVGLSAKPTRLKMVPCILKRVVISDKVRCFFRSTGQTGFHGTTQHFSGRDKRDRDNFQNFRDGTNGIGTIFNLSGRDKRDSGHTKVCPAVL